METLKADAMPPPSPSYFTPKDNPPAAAGFMVFSLCILGLQDGLIKLTSSEISLWQMQAVRASFNLLFIIFLSRYLFGVAYVAAKRPWAVALRAFFLVTTMVLFFAGVPVLSLSEIGAGLYVFPLFVALLSSLLLGEKIGVRRITAIAAGFGGALLILKPGTESFRWISMLPVAAALCYAATILTTRQLCREEHPTTLAFGVAIGFITTGLAGMMLMAVFQPLEAAQKWPYLFTDWRPLEGWVLLLIVAASLLNLVANLCLSRAYQTAESSWLAPFDYSYLIFATFWGFVIWGHVPDAMSFVGMGLIAGAGIYVAWRERQLAQKT